MSDECQTDALRLREPEWTQGIQMWMPFEFGPMEVLLAEFNEAQRSAFILLMMQEWRYGSLPPDDKRLAAICRITPTRFIRQIAPAIRPLLVDRGDGRVVTLALQERREKTLKSLAQKTRSKCEKNFKFSGQESNDINASATTDVEVDIEVEKKEESVPPTEVPAAPAAGEEPPVQTNLFGDQPVEVTAPEPTPHKRMQQHCIPILAEIEKKDLDKDAHVRTLCKQLNEIYRDDANFDADAVIEAFDHFPREDKLDRAAFVGRVKDHLKRLRVVVSNPSPNSNPSPDPNDGRGIKRWCIAAKLEPTPEGSQGKWWSPCKKAYFDVVADMVATAAQLPWNWNGDWSPLVTWIANGYTPYDITGPIKNRTTWATGYTVPSSLSFFNGYFKEPKQAVAA